MNMKMMRNSIMTPSTIPSTMYNISLLDWVLFLSCSLASTPGGEGVGVAGDGQGLSTFELSWPLLPSGGIKGLPGKLKPHTCVCWDKFDILWIHSFSASWLIRRIFSLFVIKSYVWLSLSLSLRDFFDLPPFVRITTSLLRSLYPAVLKLCSLMVYSAAGFRSWIM